MLDLCEDTWVGLNTLKELDLDLDADMVDSTSPLLNILKGVQVHFKDKCPYSMGSPLSLVLANLR